MSSILEDSEVFGDFGRITVNSGFEERIKFTSALTVDNFVY